MPELSGKLTLDGSQYNKTLTDAEKQNARFARQVNSANKTLDSFQKNAKNASTSISGMINSLRNFDLGGFTASARGAATAITSLIPAGASAGTAISSLAGAATTALGPLGLLAAAIAAVAAVGVASISSVEEFDASLRSLSALTGVSGRALSEVGDMAMEMSDKFGVASKDIVSSMELIGSQAPQLLKDMDALGKVTEAAIILKKAAGDNMTIQDSAKAITTVMNQMGVAASEATNIINSMAEGSKAGAADIQYLTTALAKSGAQGAEAGMSYQQMVAAVETIAPKFESAEVAGTALNSILIQLQTQSESKFNPAIVGIDQALENLANASLTAEEKVKLFGRAGLLAGNTLIANRQAFKDMTDQVTGTSTAYDQMATRAGGLGNTFNKLKNSLNNFLIAIGQTAPIQALIGILILVGKALTFIVQCCTKVIQAVNTMTSIVVALFVKMWQYIKPQWDALVNAITNSAIYKACAKIFQAIYRVVANVINKISNLWHRFLRWLGLETEKPKEAPVDIKVNDKELDKIDNALNSSDVTKTTKTKGAKTIEFDKGSLEYYKQQLAALEKRLTSKKLSLVDIEKTKREIEEVKKIIAKKEVELGIKAKPGSLDALEKEISEVDAKLRSLDPRIDMAEIENLQIKKEALEKAKAEVEKAVNGVVIKGKKFESNGQEGSLQYASDKVSYYTEKVSIEVEGTEQYDTYMAKLKEWTAKKHIIEAKVEADMSDIPEDTLAWLDNRMQKIEAELTITPVNTEKYEQLVKELKELTQKRQVITAKVEADTSQAKKGSLEDVTKKVSDLRAKLNLEVRGSDEYNKIKKELDAAEKEEHKLKVKIDFDNYSFMDAKDQIEGTFYSIDGAVNAIDNLQEKINESANGWEVFMAGVQAVGSTLDAVAETIETVRMIMTLLDSATQATTATQNAAAAASTANATTQVANASSVTAANSAEAISGAAASGSKWPWPINLIAIAASLAMVLGVLAMIGSFANGGIVQGSTTMGDMNLARVNSGEMILNNRQQKNLFNAIDKNNLGGGGGSQQIVGDVVVRGDKMHLLMRNYGKIKHSVGKDIGIK